MSNDRKKFATPSMTILPSRLVKDPQVKNWPAKGDKPAQQFTELTLVDGAGGNAFQDVFVTVRIDTTKKPQHYAKKLRKGHFVTAMGKIEYKTWGDQNKIEGVMAWPRELSVAPGDWTDNPCIDAGDAPSPDGITTSPGADVTPDSGQTELPW